MWILTANWAWTSCFSFQNNLKGADRSRHIFVHSATAMALNKNPAMSPSSSVHCGQYDTMYATIGCVLRKAFADDTILGVHHEPARKTLLKVMYELVHGEYPKLCHQQMPSAIRTQSPYTFYDTDRNDQTKRVT